MAAPSPTLYHLHHSIEPQGFENLCVDLLIREGYSKIIPGGKTRDNGRDAEVRYWTNKLEGSPHLAFQFSMEKRWEPKLRRDIQKILIHCKTVKQIIFVSNQSITVSKQDKLRDEFLLEHEIRLSIFDEGWFRVRLEEDHIDLAEKHLGLQLKATPSTYASQVKLHGLTDENCKNLLRHTTPESLLATLSAQTNANPEDAKAWKGLAYVYNHLKDYDNAIVAVSKALSLSEDDYDNWNLTALKATIIAEQGIESGSRLLLKKAKSLFAPFINHLNRAVDHYNLANIHNALEEQKEAESHYRQCIALESKYAPAWVNLASLLHKTKRTQEGLRCLDKALDLDPNLLEALCTKANILIITSENTSKAIELIEKAHKINPDIELLWPHFHYWHALALCKESRLPEALKIVEERLERKFDCPYLGRLSNDILSELWRSDHTYIKKAETHFALRIDSKEPDYKALHNMLSIMIETNRSEQSWRLFDEFLGLDELSTQIIAERIPLSIQDLTNSLSCIAYYNQYRRGAQLTDYAQMIYDLGITPHDDVPAILHHLLIVPYFKIASVLQESKHSEQEEINALLDGYRLASKIFASFGGYLLSTNTPEDENTQLELIAKSTILGLDLPLMEASRVSGYLYGITNRNIPNYYKSTIINASTDIHDNWIETFLRVIAQDWDIDWSNISTKM